MRQLTISFIHPQPNSIAGPTINTNPALDTELTLPSRPSVPQTSTNSALHKQGFWQRLLISKLQMLKRGSLQITDADQKMQLGDQQLNPSDDLSVSLSVNDRAFYKRTLLGGTIGAAESYMDGQWTSDDLTSLIRIMIRNLDRISTIERRWAWLKNSFHWIEHLRRRNSIGGSRRNIGYHYDLGNEFYQLFLDPTMSYSSGIFEAANNATDSMHSASIRKMESVCRKLQLTPQDHVLEIGTGWGGLAIYMAKNYGCHVTTTTISQQQYDFAVEAVRAAGLADRVTVLMQDYRNVRGRFDKLVSIEMIEAVGHQYYDQFFAQCSRLLTDRGVMLIQAITMGEQFFSQYVRRVDFIRRYVFPGGCLPSITALCQSISRVTQMRMLDQQDITPHYATTLARWRTEFMNKLEEVRTLGFDESFIRMWHFYLCYCEAAFIERRIHSVHLMFAKPNSTIDPATGPAF